MSLLSTNFKRTDDLVWISTHNNRWWERAECAAQLACEFIDPSNTNLENVHNYIVNENAWVKLRNGYIASSTSWIYEGKAMIDFVSLKEFEKRCNHYFLVMYVMKELFHVSMEQIKLILGHHETWKKMDAYLKETILNNKLPHIDSIGFRCNKKYDFQQANMEFVNKFQCIFPRKRKNKAISTGNKKTKKYETIRSIKTSPSNIIIQL